jgi:hypothetical protein
MEYNGLGKQGNRLGDLLGFFSSMCMRFWTIRKQVQGRIYFSIQQRPTKAHIYEVSLELHHKVHLTSARQSASRLINSFAIEVLLDTRRWILHASCLSHATAVVTTSQNASNPTFQSSNSASSGPLYDLEQACLVLKENKFTDWIIECGSARFNVHRISLYYKSSFFRAAMDYHFKEKQKGTLNIGEAKPKSVAFVIIYCYTGKIALSALEKAWPQIFTSGNVSDNQEAQLDSCCDLYLLADKLMLPKLKEMAAISFLKTLEPVQKTPKTPEILKALSQAYQTLPDRDPLRSALTAMLSIARPAGDPLYALAEKYDKETTIALTISRNYHIWTQQPSAALQGLGIE